MLSCIEHEHIKNNLETFIVVLWSADLAVQNNSFRNTVSVKKVRFRVDLAFSGFDLGYNFFNK